VVDVEVREQDRLQALEVDAHLTEANECAGTRINQDSGSTVDEDHVTGGRATEAARPPRT
jgi:hypothetical protein